MYSSIAAIYMLFLLSSAMLVAEVVSFEDDNDNNSTLLQDIRGDSPLVGEDYSWFYYLAKYDAKLGSDLLTTNGPFTIFLPTTRALRDMEDLFPNYCLSVDYYNAIGGERYQDVVLTDHLASILKYHIIQGEAIEPLDLVDGQLLTTMNGESVSIGVNGTISINDIDVTSAMAVPSPNGNIIYKIDDVLMPLSIEETMPDILASCDVPYHTRQCMGIRDRFEFDVLEKQQTQQRCASCSGYFQETQDYCEEKRMSPYYTKRKSPFCVPECQWYSDYCTEDCCWDTDADQPELAPVLMCSDPPCSYDGLWTVAPCDSGLTIRAGWHNTKASGKFSYKRTKKCQIQTFAKPNSDNTSSSSSSSVVWHVDCTRMWTDLKYLDPCGPLNKTLAIWMEDQDGNFVGYYLDPAIKEIYDWGNDCGFTEYLRIMPFWLIPSILVPLLCCCYFCCWRQNNKDGDEDREVVDPSASAESKTSVDDEGADAVP